MCRSKYYNQIKGVSPIKEKLVSVLQKAAVIFFACLMLITMLPPGLLTPDTPNADGEVVRLRTSEEAFSDATENGGAKIGGTNAAYLKFNLDGYADVPLDDIKSATLRLTFLKSSGSVQNRIFVKAAADTGIPSKITSFSAAFGQPLATIYPRTVDDENSLSEIDLTEYIKSILKEKKTEVVFSLTGRMPLCAALASSEHSDAAFRPVLKIVTGIAQDTDPQTLKKAELKETATVSERLQSASGRDLSTSSNLLIAGGKNEIYLKFDLVADSVLGEVSRAVLSLNKIDFSKSGAVRVYCINNNEWTADTISYETRPRGEETPVPSTAVSGAGRVNLDITQAICEARNQGISTLTIRITGEDNNPLYFSGYGDYSTQPRLYINATDDKDTVCASRAAINALGGNRAGFVTMNLANSYSAEDGGYSKIRWVEYNLDGFEQTGRHISADGTITRPKWFEGNAQIIAEAKISCGDYSTVRDFILTIPAETAPNYTGYKFGNYIDIGESKSEDEQAFEYAYASGIKRRWTGGSIFNYRTIYKNGAMALNFSCLPDSVNYLTLKLWNGDAAGGGFALSAYDSDSVPILLGEPYEIAAESSGFVYATYALPQEFTSGKSLVTLCLSGAATDGSVNETRGIYSAYLTQSPFFDPIHFSRQGEKFISDSLFGAETIKMFIRNLKAISQSIGFDEAIEEELTDPEQSVAIDPETGVIVFAGSDANLAFSIGENSAAVYERLEYFDRFSGSCPVISESDVVVVDYGDYRLLWNKSSAEKRLPKQMPEMSGVYRSITEDKYYTFSDDWQMTDDSVIPENTEVYSGTDIIIPPKSAQLLVHIADPMHDSDWRINKINGRTVSSLTFGPNEKIETITVKAVGGIPENAETLDVIFAIYESGRLVSAHRKKTALSPSREIYTIDFSELDTYVTKGRIFKVFLADNTQDLTRLEPRLEITT